MSFQYRKNLYVCEDCSASFVSIDRDAGTTPYLTKCPDLACGGTAVSSFYRIDQTARPTFEWYRATDAEAEAMPPGVREHHRMGGLFLRKIGGEAPAQ